MSQDNYILMRYSETDGMYVVSDESASCEPSSLETVTGKRFGSYYEALEYALSLYERSPHGEDDYMWMPPEYPLVVACPSPKETSPAVNICVLNDGETFTNADGVAVSRVYGEDMEDIEDALRNDREETLFYLYEADGKVHIKIIDDDAVVVVR